jgi:hypothetical protein
MSGEAAWASFTLLILSDAAPDLYVVTWDMGSLYLAPLLPNLKRRGGAGSASRLATGTRSSDS